MSLGKLIKQNTFSIFYFQKIENKISHKNKFLNCENCENENYFQKMKKKKKKKKKYFKKKKKKKKKKHPHKPNITYIFTWCQCECKIFKKCVYI